MTRPIEVRFSCNQQTVSSGSEARSSGDPFWLSQQGNVWRLRIIPTGEGQTTQCMTPRAFDYHQHTVCSDERNSGGPFWLLLQAK